MTRATHTPQDSSRLRSSGRVPDLYLTTCATPSRAHTQLEAEVEMLEDELPVLVADSKETAAEAVETVEGVVEDAIDAVEEAIEEAAEEEDPAPSPAPSA